MSSSAAPIPVQPSSTPVVESSAEDTTTSAAPTSSAPVETTSSAVPTTSEQAEDPTTTTTRPTSTSISSSSEETSSEQPTSSTSTSISVVVVTSVETVSGSTRTLTSSSSSTALIPTQAGQSSGGGGGGLSDTARNAIIGTASGVGGLLVLVGLFFFVTRYMRKRRTAYNPSEDEIRWPEAEPDSGALFTPAVRRTGGAGLGRETSMRSTTSGLGSIPTAGYASSDGHNGAGFGTFAAAGAAGAGAGYYGQQQQAYNQAPEALANPYDDGQSTYEPRDYQDHQYEESIRGGRGQLRPTNYSNLDKF